MRRVLSALLALGMMLTLCACAAKAPEPPVPDVTAIPTAAPTPVPTPTAEPTPAPTSTPVAVTPTPEPRWVKGEERVNYSVLTGTTQGAEALTIWLLSEGRPEIAAWVNQQVGEAMFTLEYGVDRRGENIPGATDATRDILLVADDRLVDSGLLGYLLPLFEERYGYSVEVISAPAATAAAMAGSADLAILAAPEAVPLRQSGAFTRYWTLCSTLYDRQETPEP